MFLGEAEYDINLIIAEIMQDPEELLAYMQPLGTFDGGIKGSNHQEWIIGFIPLSETHLPYGKQCES